MESQILRWFLDSRKAPSVFSGSEIFRWLSKTASRFPLARKLGLRKELLSIGKWLLAGLLFSCIFVPRLPWGSIASAYSLDLRGEDLFLLILGILFAALTTKKASLPEMPLVEKAFLGFLLAAEISILNGLYMRTIEYPLLSLFYLLKWVEYFLVFIITLRFTAGQREARFLLQAFFLLGIALAVYGYWEHSFPQAKAAYPNYYRLFERFPFHGDANHIGGLLVLWIGFFTGLFLKAKDRSKQALFLAAILFVFFPLIWTYSRKSYFALAGAILFSFFFPGNRKKLLLLTCLFIILGFLIPTRLSERLLDVGEAFTSVDPYHSSWAGNLSMWRESLWNFQQFFLLGSGLASRHRLFYESQYVLVLAETGLVGFSLFLFLCATLIRQAIALFRLSLSPGENGILLGWVIGFVGILIHNFSCVSWTVAKIAIPFWFLTAVALKPPNRKGPDEIR